MQAVASFLLLCVPTSNDLGSEGSLSGLPGGSDGQPGPPYAHHGWTRLLAW